LLTIGLRRRLPVLRSMADLIAALLKGATAEVALHEAMLLARGREKDTAPWAGFTAYGLVDPSSGRSRRGITPQMRPLSRRSARRLRQRPTPTKADADERCASALT
jgi:hypothetical protein